MKINVRTPSDVVIKDIDCEWNLTRPVVLDRLDCREMDLTVDRRIPISQFSVITAKDRGMVKFRGYCESNDIDCANDSKTQWAVKGTENLLNARFANRWFWKKNTTTLAEILSDTLTEGATPGLLAMANSGVPPNIAWTESDTTDYLITLAGYGTESHFGQRDIYIAGENGLVKLVEYAEDQLPFQSYGYYRDADDLQIKFTERGYSWYLHGGLYVENAYDTTVRLGDIYDSTQTLTGNLETNFDEIGDLIADIVNYVGWTLRVRDDDNYTYLDLMLSDGQGSTNGLYTIVEGEPGFISLNKSTVSDPKVHAVIGTGIGEQRYSISNSTWKGIRVHEKLEVDSGFSDEGQRLRAWVDERYNNRQEDIQYDIETLKFYHMFPGDYIKFCPKYIAPIVLRSFEIEEDSTGKTKLSLGGKRLTFVDVEDARSSLPRGMSDEYLLPLQKALTDDDTINVSDLAHTCPPSGMTFHVPYGVTKTEHRARVTLSLTPRLVDTTAKWKTSTSYVTDEEVYHKNEGITSLFRAKSNHTSAASSEPDVGASWKTYWTKAGDARDNELGRCTTEITVDGTKVPDGNIVGADVGNGGTIEVDVTDYITEEEDNVVKVWIYIEDEYELTHYTYKDHPKVEISASMNFYKRLAK